jgi:hypothetical protein
VLLLLQSHREAQIVTPRTLAKFRGPALVLPDVSEMSSDEKAQLEKFTQRGGRVFVTGADASGLAESSSVIRSSTSPGADHLAQLEKDFAKASQTRELGVLRSLPDDAVLKIEASPFVVSHTARVDGKLHVFLANFSGIIPHKQVRPSFETSARILAEAGPQATLSFLPFLGTEQALSGERSGDKMVFHLPPFDRGAVVWVNDSK